MKLRDIRKKQSVIRITSLMLIALIVMLALAPSALASAPGIVTGGKRLAEDALKWVLILVPVSAALMVAYHAWMKSLADGDPGAITERNKKMKNTIVGAAIAESASGLVTVLLAYF